MDPNKARNEEALSPEELLMFERFIQFHHNSGQVDYQTNSPAPVASTSSSSLIGHQSPVTPFSPVEQLEPSQPLGLSDWINHQSHLGAAHPAYTAGNLAYSQLPASPAEYQQLSPGLGQQLAMTPANSFSNSQLPIIPPFIRSRPGQNYPGKTQPVFGSRQMPGVDVIQQRPMVPRTDNTFGIGNQDHYQFPLMSEALNNFSTAITPQNLLIQGSRNANDGFQTGFLSSGNHHVPDGFPLQIERFTQGTKTISEDILVGDGWVDSAQNGGFSFQTPPNQDAELIALQFGVPNNLDTHNHQNNAAPQTAEGAVYNVPVIPQQVVPAPSQHVTTVPHNGDAPTSFRCLFEGCRRVFTVKGRPYNFMAHLTCHTETKQVQCIACTPHHTYRRENECKEHFIAFNPEVQWEKGSHMVKRSDEQILEELDRCGFMCSRCDTLYSHQGEVEQHWRSAHPNTQWNRNSSITIRTDSIRRNDIEAFRRWQTLVKATREGITELINRQRIAKRAMKQLQNQQQQGSNQRRRRRNPQQEGRSQPPQGLSQRHQRRRRIQQHQAQDPWPQQ